VATCGLDALHAHAERHSGPPCLIPLLKHRSRATSPTLHARNWEYAIRHVGDGKGQGSHVEFARLCNIGHRCRGQHGSKCHSCTTLLESDIATHCFCSHVAAWRTCGSAEGLHEPLCSSIRSQKIRGSTIQEIRFIIVGGCTMVAPVVHSRHIPWPCAAHNVAAVSGCRFRRDRVQERCMHSSRHGSTESHSIISKAQGHTRLEFGHLNTKMQTTLLACSAASRCRSPSPCADILLARDLCRLPS
jgi:hypothetical protein